jgi:excisionase family DNA binding protein
MGLEHDKSGADAPLTMTVPEAGWRYLGLNRNASYAAAARGEIPTIRVGRLLRVPIRAMERLLDAAGRRNG